MGSFFDDLKMEARRLVGREAQDWDGSVSGIARREAALILEQMERVKKLHEEQLLRLLRVECYVENELHDMERRMPPYSPQRFPERDKLQRRLWEIEKERQRLKLRLEEKVRGLEERLVVLLV